MEFPTVYKSMIRAGLTWCCGGSKGAFHHTGGQGRILVQGYLKYPPNVQVYNESRLDLVEGGRELIIRRAEPVDRGEYTCTAHLKYLPISQSHTLDILGKHLLTFTLSLSHSPCLYCSKNLDKDANFFIRKRNK